MLREHVVRRRRVSEDVMMSVGRRNGRRRGKGDDDVINGRA